AGGMAGLFTPDRRSDGRRCEQDVWPEGAGVHLRSDRARRDRRGCRRGGRRSCGAHQDRALRSDWDMTMESDRDLMLDGNAAAGMLQEIFGEEMTTALTTCDHC